MTDKIISIVVIVLVFVMVCFLVMCAVEIILGIRERRDQAPVQDNSNNQNNVQPIYIPFYGMPTMPMAQPAPVAQETAATAPAPVVEEKKEEPAPVVEEKKEEPAPVVEENESEVAFEVKAERLTLKQAYAELPTTKKKVYDKLMNEIVSLEKVRCKESMYAYTVMQGQSTIARLKISRGVIVLDVTLVNAELKAYGKETGNKVKTKPTRFKIVADADLAPAVFTLKVANNTALEARGVKPENN